MQAVDRDTFEALVEAAVAALPQGFRERIDNVTFAVEDWANRRDLSLVGTAGGGTLLGIYRGVPLTRRTSGYNLAMPDVIVIFQQPHQRMARDADHLSALVEHTVRARDAMCYKIGPPIAGYARRLALVRAR